MVKLIAQETASELLPVAIGGLSLAARGYEAITWVAPFDGQMDSVTKALGGFPAAGEVLSLEAGRAISVGPGQAMILGQPVAPDGAAVVDQSDGWSVLTLSGPGSADALARLTPLDLRLASFPIGQTARTLLGHMVASITRDGVEAFELMVFRSMTQTAVHELSRAMQGVQARANLVR